jgi:hypothetical protein
MKWTVQWNEAKRSMGKNSGAKGTGFFQSVFVDTFSDS